MSEDDMNENDVIEICEAIAYERGSIRENVDGKNEDIQAIKTIIELYKQEKEWTEKAIQTSKMYKEYWINLGNEIKQIRHKAKSRVDYDLADVIRDLTKIIGDE